MAHHSAERRDGASAQAPDVRPLLLVLAAALLWSTGGLFIKWSSLSAFELTFWRSLLACLTVAFFTRREGFGFNLLAALGSILYGVLLLCFVIATKLTTSANAIFLQYTAPVYMMALEPPLYKEKFRLADLFVVVVCVGGMSLFFVGQLDPQYVRGNLYALCSGFSLALYFLLLRHPRSRRVNRASSVIYGNLLLVLFTAPAGLKTVSHLSATDAFIVLYLGVVQIGVAYTLFTLGMARGARALDAGIVGYIEPVLNPVWVFLFIGEQPSRWAILGGTIIISAVILHTLWNGRRRMMDR